MNEPLTKSDFLDWRNSSFDPHVEREERLVGRVEQVESQIASWVKVIVVSVALITTLGGAFVALFGWSLASKNNQIEAMQRDLSTVALTQKAVVARLEANSEELKRMATVDVEMMRTMIELIKQQSFTNGKSARK